MGSEVSMRCPDCGEIRDDISIRQMRRLRNQNIDPRCQVCRSIPNPAKVEQRHLNFWITRYSEAWIRETGQMIWGEDDSGDP
jgi:hypothetical protein